jgi:putative endonuclease
MDRLVLGRMGEDAAAVFLQRCGMRILERNWRSSGGELDIIAGDGDCLVICEVKTRRSTVFGEPIEAVGTRKLRRLRSLAGAWLDAHSTHAPRIRIDVVGILVPPNGPVVITHLRGVE